MNNIVYIEFGTISSNKRLEVIKSIMNFSNVFLVIIFYNNIDYYLIGSTAKSCLTVWLTTNLTVA